MNAEREAKARKRDNDGLNALGGQSERAYSPTHNTVGLREAGSDDSFRIPNINYPMYGHAQRVTDWVSVGCEKPRKGWHWRLCGNLWKQFLNTPDESYEIIDGMLVRH